MGLKPGRPYCTRRRHHHLSVAPTNLDSKNEELSPQNRGQSPPIDEGRDPPRLHGLKATETRRSMAALAGGTRSDRLGVRLESCTVSIGPDLFNIGSSVFRNFYKNCLQQ
jgi:hypothetical protein